MGKHPSNHSIQAYGYDVIDPTEGFTVSIMRINKYSKWHVYVCVK